MTDSGVEYETQAIRAIRGMEARTVAKWEQQGWEVVSQSQVAMQTVITIRRPKSKAPWKWYAIGGGVLAVVLSVVIVSGVISENAAEQDDAPAAVASASVAPSDASPAEEAEPTEPAEPEPTEPEDVALTPETNEELARLLTLGDYCDPSIPAFAEKYGGQTVSFEGYIGAMNPHDSATTRYDILIGAGDFSETSAPGPTFQFRDVNATNDLHYTGDVPDSIGVGANLGVAAEVGEYEESSCLFLLDPVETSFR